MSKKYRFYDQSQTLLLPPNINDWIPDKHLARFVSNVVNDLDISKITDYYECEDRGAPPYDPLMMVKVRLYADCIGTPSSRVINRLMHENIAFRYLGAGNFPDFRTISDFRKIHHKSLSKLFHQVLDLCKQANLVKVGTVAIDGTKIKANASIDKNFTEKRLSKKEDEIENEAKKIIKDGIKVDEEEDRLYGPNNDGYSMPDDALERVRKAKRQLEDKKKKELEEYERKLSERKEREKKRRG